MFSEVVRLATCQLNQWALDFEGNLERVKQSIREAKRLGAKFRTGPELELSGYGCEDHFLETDTINHCWKSLESIINDPDLTEGILCDIGMPLQFRSSRYNCRVYCIDHKLLLIRPKTDMSGDGNYRESRYFAAWNPHDLTLYDLVIDSRRWNFNQESVKIGLGIIDCFGVGVGSETCEELWTLQASHTSMMLDGVDIIANGSASHHELRKLSSRLELILGATAKGGGAYLYANQRGCDGGRLYFDGSALIALNGQILTLAPQFTLDDVTVITADISIDSVRSYRCRLPSLMAQAARRSRKYPRIISHFCLSSSNPLSRRLRQPISLSSIPAPMEEIAGGPPCWLWDYLRRSGACGFFLPLSGGADSAAVAAMVGAMCQRVLEYLPDQLESESSEHHGPTDSSMNTVLVDIERILKIKYSDPSFPKTHRDLANLLLHTCYMGSTNSSTSTAELASDLSNEIGAYHLRLNIDTVVTAFLSVFTAITRKVPQFLGLGGSLAEDLALQNLQARVRMVCGYLLASLLPWVRGRRGFLLVLATANADEALRGYMTKYDCSSGDINPIGSISKLDLRRFLNFAADKLNYRTLHRIVSTVASAELRPIMSRDATEHTQSDEVDMGLTYDELSIFGRLRRVHRCGPVSTLETLLGVGNLSSAGGSLGPLNPRRIAEKVKHFFTCYAIHRHKMTVLTPSYHAEAYSPDDNRYDHRPFLYPPFTEQYRMIDNIVDIVEEAGVTSAGGTSTPRPSIEARIH